MDIVAYYERVERLIGSIKRHIDQGTTLCIRPPFKTTISGVFGTELAGIVRTKIGYEINVRRELIWVDPAGSVAKKAYRYILSRGGVEVIRFQTDSQNYAANAHFPPNFISGNGKHFEKHLWSPELQDPDFEVIYKFFSRIIREEGQLPEPFRSAK